METAEEINEEKSYDILEWFPILYCQNVFKYLSGKDVIQASAVNKEWYKFTAESQQAAKYKLSFGERFPTDEDKEILKNSKRKYQNIKFDGFAPETSTFLLELLATRAGSWKSVTIIRVHTHEDAFARSLFGIIEPTVEELTLEKLNMRYREGVRELMDVESKWTFPCLKSLDYSKNTLGNYNFYQHLQKCTSLSKAMLDMWRPTKEYPEILQVLRNNADLKELDAEAHDWPWLEHSSEFKFKLRKLKFTVTFTSAAQVSYLPTFLEVHAQTLNSFETNVKLEQASLQLILNDMPRLSLLIFDLNQIRESISGWQQPFPINTTITKLQLTHVVSSENLTAYETLIRALRGLKHINFDSMLDDHFNFLAREVPGLESIEVYDFYVSCLPEHEIFPNIKRFKMSKFRWGSREPTSDYKFAALVRKEKRLLSESN